MAASEASKSDTMVLTAGDGILKTVDKRPRIILLVVTVPMLVAGLALLSTGLWGGIFLAGYGALFLVASLVRPIVTTFDFAQQRITIEKVGLFHTSTRHVPFSIVRGLSIKSGGGAELLLLDGCPLKVTNRPASYVALERRLIEIRAKLDMEAADAPVIFEISSASQLFGSAMLFLSAFGFGALSVFELWVMVAKPSDLSERMFFLLGAILMLLSALFLVAIGLSMFGAVKRLVLDPATRQAHLILVWPIIRSNEYFAFADVANVGVLEHHSEHKDDTYYIVPYMQLKSGRRIELLEFSKDFHTAREISWIIHQKTGAEFRNISSRDRSVVPHDGQLC